MQYERAMATELAAMRQHQYPLPSYFANAGVAQRRRRNAQRRLLEQVRDARLRRRLETGNQGRSGHFGAGCSSHFGAGGSSHSGAGGSGAQ
jgi:uncharacterized membrane protein YgcG